MDFISFTKKNLTELPYPIGRLLSFVPYGLRPGLGSVYKQRVNEIRLLERSSDDAKKQFVFERMSRIVKHAYENVPFYKKYYDSLYYDPKSLVTFEDIRRIPIVSKANLQDFALEDRSYKTKSRSIVNSGGSSGTPLHLYIEPSSVGHEWAHMHTIWAKSGFKQSDIKVVLAGQFKDSRAVSYDSARNQFTVDIYGGWERLVKPLLRLYKKRAPRYLHGYPSAIFDFVVWLNENENENEKELLGCMRQHTECIFLSSEYPQPQVRENVEALLKCQTISWYGHTERAMLAFEGKCGMYHPFISYGLCEAIPMENDEKLVATSYYNFASPLIRYDTGDTVIANITNDLVNSFKISTGRIGDFIYDRNRNKIALTAMVFGRHHELFNHARQLQVRQNTAGHAEILVVPRTNELSEEEMRNMFDSSNLELELRFTSNSEPVRTMSGKVPLLVK